MSEGMPYGVAGVIAAGGGIAPAASNRPDAPPLR